MGRPDPSGPSCFGRRLARGPSGWAWTDGVAEACVFDLPCALADLRTRDGDLVEVPARLARIYDAMQCLIDGCNRGTYDVDVSTGAFPAMGRATASTCLDPRRRAPRAAAGVMVILVPVADWRAWVARCDLLPTWSPDDEDAIVQRATDRGWREGWSEIAL